MFNIKSNPPDRRTIGTFLKLQCRSCLHNDREPCDVVAELQVDASPGKQLHGG